MPIYEYKCTACGTVTSLLQKISDPAPEKCESCNKGPLEKILSSTAFILKGGGWYSDAYSSKSNASKSTAASSSGTPPAAGTPASPAKETKSEPAASTPKPPKDSC